VGGGDTEDGEGFRGVFFEPGCELRSRLLIAGHDVAEPPLGLGRLIRVEDSADVARDLWPHSDLGGVGHRVSHEMELASLPGHSGEDGLPGGLEPAVIIAYHEFHAPHASIDEALEEGSPVRLGFEELDTTAEDAPLAIGADPDGREQGAGHDRPAVADFFVAGIEDEVRDLPDWPVAPGTELLVEFGRRPAYLIRPALEPRAPRPTPHIAQPTC